MLVRQVCVALAIAALSGAVPAPVKHVLHEKRSEHVDWVKGERIKRDSVLPVRIGLTQNNLEKGEEYLMAVSDPKSARYGQYWSAEEVHEMFAPSKDTVDSVRRWLESSGIHESRIVHSDNKGWLAFDAYMQEVEDLFKTEFYEHEHASTSSIKIGCEEYHVPEHIQAHIDYITPGVKLSPIVKKSTKQKRMSHLVHSKGTVQADDSIKSAVISEKAKSLPADLQKCGTEMTPACIKALYNIPDATKAHKDNSLGLYEQGDYFAKSDLDLYYKAYAPWIPQGTYPIPALIDGANFSVPDYSPLNQGESDIDIDMAYSLIYPQSVTLYQVDDQIYEPEEVATTNLFNTFLDALDGSYCTYSAFGETGNNPDIDPIYPNPRPGGYKGKLQCGVYKPTNVISASYGQAEADLPVAYTKRQCNEFLKLGLQGHSILFSSGDYGVASFHGDGSANGCLGPEGKIFNPQYPSNCPYVTSVGGTMLYADQTIKDAESVMHADLGGDAANFSSAGGFSNYFPQPLYQRRAVEKYFKKAKLSYPHYSEMEVNVNKTEGLFNRIGRAYPDVAANGALFPAYSGGKLHHFYGASLSSPLFASVLTLINEERLAKGKGPIGFVNPVLYAHPEVLNDITNGTSAGCNTDGFSAIPGWDPATGLGTPNYPKLKKLFLSLP
ncbi:Peptidase S8/S53, subtilisin/kexin/sedolisin [Penicillium griseofulvum]|uniref:Peptidase S8/S53, subtilisin/kexin/sedolisin n=1 Tax=Penicillium patulum TaxID=5078 RepID=A0A135LUM9_PENPA|nr:Peptidase S8/S53, subtilisin/kexin/sedolisin [Penicillium griseofulvum]KXG52611.1 Peptidase S8/S53, subtilisin/kexin/sedolisin [Penicillium griseofulvum]